jgi:hypothetical protein
MWSVTLLSDFCLFPPPYRRSSKEEHWAGWSCSNTLDLYSGGAWFKSWLGHSYPDLDFYDFPQLLQANSRIVPQLGHYYFLTNPLQFISHWSSFDSVLYSLDSPPHHHHHIHTRARACTHAHSVEKTENYYINLYFWIGHAVAWLVEALSGFDSWWGHWNFQMT